jgi:hypothetical protein
MFCVDIHSLSKKGSPAFQKSLVVVERAHVRGFFRVISSLNL